MRFLIYLVSLALSLAALSILKLHKLLEWLMVVSDFCWFWECLIYFDVLAFLSTIRFYFLLSVGNLGCF